MYYQIGYGSQGKAWAMAMKKSQKEIPIVLRSPESPSWKAAMQSGYRVLTWQQAVEDLKRDQSNATTFLAMLCPDASIAPLYREYLCSIERPLCLILATGFAVASGELEVRHPLHQVALLAPKVIGTELAKSPGSHLFQSAIQFPNRDRAKLIQIAEALGFSEDRRIESSFEQETVADLISEQSLLCGGLFPLVQWTMEEMRRAGAPESLIRAECLDELEFLARTIRELGPAKAFAKISQTAQAGTLAMVDRMRALGLREAVADQAAEVRSGVFYEKYRRGDWKKGRDAFLATLREEER